MDATAHPPQYIFQEPYGRLLICASSCTFQDESPSGVPEPEVLQLLFSTGCEQMGMRPAVNQVGLNTLAALTAYYPPGFSALAYRGQTRDGGVMVGFGIFALGTMLMIYFVGAEESDFVKNDAESTSYFEYVRLIKRFID